MFYTLEENEFVLHKLVAIHTPDLIAVVLYWPSDVEPISTNLSQFELRNSCALIDSTVLEFALFVKNESIKVAEMEAYSSAVSIYQGLKNRKLELERLHEAAKNSFESDQFSKAIDLYTELAPFDKLNPLIYINRGKSYLNLGFNPLAQADFEFATSLDPLNFELKMLCDTIPKKR